MPAALPGADVRPPNQSMCLDTVAQNDWRGWSVYSVGGFHNLRRQSLGDGAIRLT